MKKWRTKPRVCDKGLHMRKTALLYYRERSLLLRNPSEGTIMMKRYLTQWSRLHLAQGSDNLKALERTPLASTQRPSMQQNKHPAQDSTSPPASQAFSFINALYRCDIRFYIATSISTKARTHKTSLRHESQLTFALFSISAYVVPSYSKIGSHPKSGGPLAGTIFPSVLPWNKIGSSPGPPQNANVHTADADLSVYAASKLFRPSCPRAARKCLLDR
jgi:hypothetical protein